MKKISKKIISIILCLVLLMSVCSAAFVSFAESEKETFSAPDIQTMLKDGKALKAWLEDSFLNLENADSMLAENLDAIATSVAPMLTDLYYYMGYNEADYPSDLESLELCFARALSSLSDKMFREPEPIETIDISLLYNLAYIGGTDYIESVNASLPEELRFNTSSPVLKLNDEQKASLSEYYAKWKAGALKLDGFNIKDYLGDLTSEEFLRDVLLVFIADDSRLPSITKTALGFEFGYSEKCAAARAAADIIDNLRIAPVSAVIRQLSDTSLQRVIANLVEVANMLTVSTDSYSYRLFTEGIFTDTDGSAIPYIVKDGDTYRYEGPTMVSEYLATINAALDLFAGIDKELESSVLETVFSKRLDKLATLASAALDAAFATVASEQLRLQNEIDCANIEIRFADKKIEELTAAQNNQSQIESQNAQLASINEEIAQLQEQLAELENQIETKKADNQGYYDCVAQVEEEGAAPNEDYELAKQKVAEIEEELAPLYEQKDNLSQTISQKTETADSIAKQLDEAEETDYDEIAVWQKAKEYAQGVIAESTEKLAALPDASAVENVYNTVKPLVASFFTAFDGVYDSMINETTVKAAIKLVYGLENFIDVIENIDWDAIAPVTDPIFKSIDSYIDSIAGNFIGENGGENLLTMLSDFLNGFLDQYGVYNFVKTDYLDQFIKETILADNSDIMKAAAKTLSQMFGNVEPTYQSIVSCLIPILSAFDFAVIMNNMDDLSGALTLASPSAFAYLAGLQSPNLEDGYLDRITASLRENGYTGSSVEPIISLSDSAASGLLSYVSMEKNGSSLEEIAAAGFNWKDYLGDTSTLDIANALVKIALGDSDKLGSIASMPGVGNALVNLLCDLLNDLQTKPVTTLLAKVSNPENLTPIANLVFGLMGGDDSSYKSYELFYDMHIYKDKDGNTTFYDAVVDGSLKYVGPKALEYYVPLVASAIDLFSGISDQVTENNGDLLKTLLFNKLPQIKNLIVSAISFKDEAGNDKAGAIFYLLLGYGDFAKAQNESLSYDILIGLNELAIQQKQLQIETKDEQLAFLQSKLEEIRPEAEALKLAKAIELGVLPEGTTTYSDEAVEQALAQKTAEAAENMAIAQQGIENAQAEVDRLEPIVEEAKAPYNEYDGWLFDFALGAFFDDLKAVFEADEFDSALEAFIETYADEYNGMVGEDAFAELVNDITEAKAKFDPVNDDIDDFTNAFVEEHVLYGGLAGDKDLELQEAYAAVNDQLEEAKTQLTTAQSNYLLALIAYNDYSGGSVANKIESAANSAKINIKYEPLDLNGDFNEKQIKELIQTTMEEDVQTLTDAIAALEVQSEEYAAAKAAAAEKASGFNFTLIPLAAQAADTIAQGVVDILAGKAEDGSQNVYNYIMNKDIVGILTSEGRLQSLFEIIVGIYAPALNALVSQGMLSEETAAQLIAATPSFDSFYKNELAAFPNAFKANPVPATAALINAFCCTILTGFEGVENKNKDTMQIELIDADIADIFSKTSGTDWADSYSKSVITRTGEIYRLIVDLLGLSFIRELVNDDPAHTHSYTDVVKPPTCTRRGYTIHTCACGDMVIDTYVPALGHRFEANEQYCLNGCGTVNPDYVPPHVHSYTEAVTTAATCTTAGVRTFTCECGDTYTEPIPALGHNMTFHDGVQETCTTAGNKPYYECERCHNYYIDDKGDNLIADKTEVVIPAKQHRFESNEQYCLNGCGTVNPDYVPPVPVHIHEYTKTVVAPKANAVGYTLNKCACGDSYKDNFKAPTGKPTGFKCASRAVKSEKFTWSKTKGVSGYQIQLLNAKGGNAGLKALAGNSYTFTKLAAGHAYKARLRFFIKAENGKNYYGAWVTINSPTLPAGTSLAKVTGAKKAFTAHWKKGACTGYQLQYSTNKKFSAAKTVTIKKASIIKYTVKKLASKKTYYVRIRTYKTMNKANYYSAWSAAKAVKTK